MPGLGLPWKKQAAESLPLQISLSMPTARPEAAAEGNSTAPAARLAAPTEPAEPASAASRAPVSGLQMVPLPRTAPAPAPAPAPASQATARKRTAARPGKPAVASRRRPSAMKAEAPDLVAVDSLHQDSFVVAVRHPDELRSPEAQLSVSPASVSAAAAEPVPEPPAPVLVAEAASPAEASAPEQPPVEPASMPARAERQARNSLSASAQIDTLQNQKAADSSRLNEQLGSASRQQAQQAFQRQRELQEAEQVAEQQAEQLARQMAQQLVQREIPLPAQADSKAIPEIEHVVINRQDDRLARLERLRKLQAGQREREQQQALNQQLEQQPVSDQRNQQAIEQLLSQRAELSATQTAQSTQPAQPTPSIGSRPGPANITGDARQQQTAALAGSAAAEGRGGNSNGAGERGGNTPGRSGGSQQGGNERGGGELEALLGKPLASAGDLASRARQQLQDSRRNPLGLPAPPPASARERRYSVFGGFERDIQIRMYVEGWKQKIERNGNLNYSSTAYQQARAEPIVTVVIRSDGSVEDIVIHRSSGRADLDQAVRNIVRLNARYAAFPPQIAAQYDVLEIRRIWSFEEHLKLLEELR